MNELAFSGCCKKRKERIGLEKGEAFVKALKNATPSTINFNYATPIFLLFCNVILIQSLKYCVRHWRTLSICVVGFSHIFFSRILSSMSFDSNCFEWTAKHSPRFHGKSVVIVTKGVGVVYCDILLVDCLNQVERIFIHSIDSS